MYKAESININDFCHINSRDLKKIFENVRNYDLLDNKVHPEHNLTYFLLMAHNIEIDMSFSFQIIKEIVTTTEDDISEIQNGRRGWGGGWALLNARQKSMLEARNCYSS